MSTLSVSFEQTEQDIRDAQSHFFRRGKYRWRSLLWVRTPALFAVWGALVLLLATLTHERDAVLIFGGATGAFTLVALIVAAQVARMPSAQAKAVLKDPQLRPRNLGVQNVTILPEGLRWSHPIGEGWVTWPGVSRIEQDPGMLYIFVGPAGIVMVPDRAFESAEDRDTFRGLAQQCMGSRLIVPNKRFQLTRHLGLHSESQARS